MATRLTAFSRLLITLVILLALFFFIRYLLNEYGNSSIQGADSPSEIPSLTIGISSWPGYAPAVWRNRGQSPSDSSQYYIQDSLRLNIRLYNGEEQISRALQEGEIDAGAMSWGWFLYHLEDFEGQVPRVLGQLDWSRGVEALVAREGIETVNQIEGKRVGIGTDPMAPWQLYSLLSTADLSLEDIQIQSYPKVEEAFQAFENKEIEALSTTYPEWQRLMDRVYRSEKVIGTETLTHLVAHVLVAPRSLILEKKEAFKRLYEGWMTASADINNFREDKELAARSFAKLVGNRAEDIFEKMLLIRFSNHGDNLNFFNRNVGYDGATGEIPAKLLEAHMKNEKGRDKYLPDWESLLYADIVLESELFYKIQEGEGDRNFRQIDDASSLPALASHPFYLEYPDSENGWSESDLEIIRTELLPLIQLAGLARIRISTHFVGEQGPASNVNRASDRAQMLIDLLVKRFKMDADRFDIRAMGAAAPAPGCANSSSPDCLRMNRRTEIQILPLK